MGDCSCYYVCCNCCCNKFIKQSCCCLDSCISPCCLLSVLQQQLLATAPSLLTLLTSSPSSRIQQSVLNLLHLSNSDTVLSICNCSAKPLKTNSSTMYSILLSRLESVPIEKDTLESLQYAPNAMQNNTWMRRHNLYIITLHYPHYIYISITLKLPTIVKLHTPNPTHYNTLGTDFILNKTQGIVYVPTKHIISTIIESSRQYSPTKCQNSLIKCPVTMRQNIAIANPMIKNSYSQFSLLKVMAGQIVYAIYTQITSKNTTICSCFLLVLCVSVGLLSLDDVMCWLMLLLLPNTRLFLLFMNICWLVQGFNYYQKSAWCWKPSCWLLLILLGQGIRDQGSREDERITIYDVILFYKKASYKAIIEFQNNIIVILQQLKQL